MILRKHAIRKATRQGFTLMEVLVVVARHRWVATT
jgi:hypothetical protein